MPCKPTHLTTRTHFFLLCSRWGSGRTFRMPSFPISPVSACPTTAGLASLLLLPPEAFYSVYVCLPNVVMTISLRSSHHCADPVFSSSSPSIWALGAVLWVWRKISEIQTFPTTCPPCPHCPISARAPMWTARIEHGRCCCLQNVACLASAPLRGVCERKIQKQTQSSTSTFNLALSLPMHKII
jgi:hypothetical protein